MSSTPLCGAPTAGGGSCRLAAGWGTSHVGSGRCRKHRGNDGGAGAPVGNNNAATHGGYRSVFLDRLTGDDLAVFEAAPRDPADALDDALAALAVREVRVLTFVLGLPTGHTRAAAAEELLTRIQAEKRRVAEAKIRADTGAGDGLGEIDAVFRELRGEDDYLAS